MTPSRLKFTVASGLKWGASVWLVTMLLKVSYEYLFHRIHFTLENLVYAFFFFLFWFGWGCLLGFFMWPRVSRQK